MLSTMKREKITLNDEMQLMRLFLISNTLDICHIPMAYDITDEPLLEELTAPSLSVRPVFDPLDSDEKIEKIWHSFTPSYIGSDLDAEIIQALKGKSQDWKLIRCCPDCYGYFFVLANPTLYLQRDSDIALGESLEEDMQRGVVWAHLESSKEYEIEVKARRRKKNGKLKTYATYQLSAGHWTVCRANYKHMVRRMTWYKFTGTEYILSTEECFI